jgi:hypothetical protein
MINNPTAQYYFAGLGFTMLDLDIRDGPLISIGSITNQSLTQPLRDISFNGATGTISFAVAESPEQVRDILFTGNAITDGTGFVTGFTGTWEGERVIVIRTQNTAEAVLAVSAAQTSGREEAALPGRPPSGLAVQGSWVAILAPQIQ